MTTLENKDWPNVRIVTGEQSAASPNKMEYVPKTREWCRSILSSDFSEDDVTALYDAMEQMMTARKPVFAGEVWVYNAGHTIEQWLGVGDPAMWEHACISIQPGTLKCYRDGALVTFEG